MKFTEPSDYIPNSSDNNIANLILILIGAGIYLAHNRIKKKKAKDEEVRRRQS